MARQGRRLAARTIEGSGDYRLTVAATVAFCDVTLQRYDADLRRGVYGVDELFTLAELRPVFEAKGITIRDPLGG